MDEAAERDGEQAALWALYRGLRGRTYERPGGDDLTRLASSLGSVYARPPRPIEGERPPRRVAVAFALALASLPHLAHTLPRAFAVDDDGVRPLSFHPDVVHRVLGVPQWEFDDLKDEADRRAAFALKQARLVGWLASRFESAPAERTEGLFRGLLPDARGLMIQRFQTVGTRLYAVVSGLPARPRGEALGWAPHRSEPVPRVRSRWVDAGLRRSLARSVGAEAGEIDALLELTVAVLPVEDADELIERDGWRSAGWAALTGIGEGHVDEQLATMGEDTGWRQWLREDAGRIEVRADARALFDALGAMRCNQLMWSLLAPILTRGITVDFPEVPDSDDLDMLDFSHHLGAVCQPLLRWIVANDTHATLARELGVPVAPVARALVNVAGEWVGQADSMWLGPPREDQPGVATLLIRHVLALQSSLARNRGIDRDERLAMILFAAHHARESRVERLWRWAAEGSGSSIGWTDDPVGEWFTTLWTRLLEADEPDVDPTEWG